MASNSKTPGPETGKSGISGPANVEEAPEPEGPRNLAGRWKQVRDSARGTFAAVPRVLRLVWGCEPGADAGDGGHRAPRRGAARGRGLHGQAADQRRCRRHRDQHPAQAAGPDALSPVPLPLVTIRSPVLTAVAAIVVLAVVQLLLTAIGALISTVRNIAQQLMQERMQIRIQLMVMERAAQP